MMFKYIVAIILVTAHLTNGQSRTVSTRTRTRTTTTRTQVIGPSETRTIRLSGGELLSIDSETLTRLQNDGVDINNLQNLSEADLEALGISLSTSTVNLQTDSGSQTIRLRGGQILTIDSVTLQRLQDQGVDINNIQNLSEQELEQLGITLSTRTVSTGSGSRTVRILPGTTRTITLRDGQVITVDTVTLETLQNQGIDIDNLQSLSEQELERLGLIVTTRTVSVARPVTRTQVTRTQSERTDTGLQGIQVLAAPRPTPAPIPLAPRGGGARPRPPPPAPRPPPEEENEEANPAPEPYSFSYTAETDDGSVSEREESQDASGVITGFYTLRDADGNARRVDYVADANGYRATITTNEIGTESKSPADVDLQSSAPTAEVLTKQYQEEQDRLNLQNANQPGRLQPQQPRGLQPQQPRRVASGSSGQGSFSQQRANQRAAANIEIIRPSTTETLRASRTDDNNRFVLRASVNRDGEPSEPVARFVASSSQRSAAASERYGTKS